MPAPIVHVDVRALDYPGLTAFYRDVFDWERDEPLSIEGYDVVDCGVGRITAGVGPVPDWKANAAVFYIQVDDIDTTLERIEREGGRRIMPKTVGPDDFPAQHINTFTQFLDPAGNVVGLVETPPK